MSKECQHTSIGQKYDTRRGCGNGPQHCFKCKLTVDQILKEKHEEGYKKGVAFGKATNRRCVDCKKKINKICNKLRDEGVI